MNWVDLSNGEILLWVVGSPTGGLKNVDKLVDELFADIIGVLAVESPRTGEVGIEKLFDGEFGLLFLSLCCT